MNWLSRHEILYSLGQQLFLPETSHKKGERVEGQKVQLNKVVHPIT